MIKKQKIEKLNHQGYGIVRINNKVVFVPYAIKDDVVDEDVEDVGDLPVARKTKLAEIEEELKTVVHSDFNYYNYSEQDNSNKRFMDKQENTSLLRDGMFNKAKDNEQPVVEETIEEEKEGDLFGNDDYADEEFPF